MWRSWLQSLRKIPTLVTGLQRTSPECSATFYVRYDADSVSHRSVEITNEREDGIGTACADSAIDVSAGGGGGSGDLDDRKPIDRLRSNALKKLTKNEQVSKSAECLLDAEEGFSMAP